MRIKKFLIHNKFTSLIAFLITILFLYYETPWGLMDDYKNLILIQDLISSPFQTYFKFTYDRTFISGMFQPFYLLQMFFQYYPGVLIFPGLTYIFNSFILLYIHQNLFKAVKRIYDIDYQISLTAFLIWPYTYDLFLHPSLQEKFIFLLFSFLLLFFADSKKEKHFKIFLVSFTLPLIKLQGSIFIGYSLVMYLQKKSKKTLISIVGFSIGIFIQAYIIFFIDTDYFVYSSNISKFTNNLLILPNFLFFLLTIFFLLVMVIFNKEKRYESIGLFLSSIFLIFIYSNWNIYGYLLASYAFFIAIFVPILYIEILEKTDNLKRVKSYFKPLFVLLMVISMVNFFIPRLERWQQITEVVEELKNPIEEKVYYCAIEGTQWLNQIENIDNEIFFVNNLREIKDEYFYFINDEFQCSFFTTELRNNCNTLTEVFPRKRFYLTKNSC